jgi:hypothetical protein
MMTILNLREALLASALLLVAMPACAQGGRSPVRPQPGQASPDVASMIPNACYQGIEADKEVCLKNGRSEGPPVVELGPDRASGDLDGDGAPETALLLTRNPGDPQQETYLVLAAWRGDRIVTLATTRLGNQVRVKSFKISGGKVHLEGQRSASARTAMMPVSLSYSLRQGKLVEDAQGPQA